MSTIVSAAPKAEAQLSVISSLTLNPSSPSAGQAVTARFSIRNDGATSVTLDRLGVGGRGPGCPDFSCENYQDFPFDLSVTINPGQTYSYEQQRAFATAGAYFFQISYEEPATAWHFLGQRIDFAVGRGLELTQPLLLTPQNSSTKDLVQAEFEVTNAGTSTITLQKIGVGVRGPDCVPADWGCAARPDYPFAENLTLSPGQRYAFRSWKVFVQPGQYFAQVSVLDALGSWGHLGVQEGLAVTPATYEQRSVPLRFGVQWHPTWIEANDNLELGLAASVGAKVIRIGASWRMLEPTGKGVWDTRYIADLNRLIGEANKLGSEVYLMLLEVPCWASSDPAKDCVTPNPDNACKAGTWDCSYPPVSNGDYADAFRKLAELYGDRVTVWEVWNEPNVARFWKPAPDPTEYVQLLKSSFTAIKGEQPHATVLGGSLAGADYAFLDAMYAAGARSYFDALALHPYTSGPPGDCTDMRWSFACGIDGVRSMMLRHGDDKDIWLTEFGWATYGPLTETMQRDYLIDALAELTKREFVKAVSWYTLVNTDFEDLPPDLPHDNDFGLFYRNHSPKLSAQWLQAQLFIEKLFLPHLGR